jgi:hypothetical protein
MQLDKLGGRQQGQVAIILGLAFTAVLGMTAFAIDLGFGYAKRREVQNAADAGALAGVQALGRHYLYAKNGKYTDAMILAEITKTAAADVPGFVDLGTSQTASPPWPTGTGNSLVAYYLAPNQSQLAQVGSIGTAAPPATAAGVRVEARLRQPTFFAPVLGINYLGIYASGRAMLQSASASGGTGGAPFIVCVGGARTLGDGTIEQFGSYRVKNANGTAPPEGTHDLLLTSTTPPTVDPSLVGHTYLIHSSQLKDPESGQSPTTSSACGNDTGAWKGALDSSQPCVPTGSDPLPCLQPTLNGDRAGPIGNLVAGYTSCSPSVTTNCVALLAITTSCTSTACTVIALAPFYMMAGLPPAPRVNVPGCTAANCYSGTLLSGGATTILCGGGCEPDGEFDPDNPGIFTYSLVPDS